MPRMPQVPAAGPCLVRGSGAAREGTAVMLVGVMDTLWQGALAGQAHGPS